MSFRFLESMLRRTANICGLDLTRYRPWATPAGRLTSMLAQQNVDLVLDVGANVGQFAQGLRRAGYTKRILSFEPLAQAHAQLIAASRADALWDIAPRVAIGDREDDVLIHVSGNSVSSSILAMLDSHVRSAPQSEYVRNESVHLTTLDTVLQKSIEDGVVPFLKIDTQGYEDRVLDGAQSILRKIQGLQLELSFLPLYEGQQLFDPLMSRLRTLGFVVWAIYPGFYDSKSGRMLQVDAVLFREQ